MSPYCDKGKKWPKDGKLEVLIAGSKFWKVFDFFFCCETKKSKIKKEKKAKIPNKSDYCKMCKYQNVDYDCITIVVSKPE